MDVVLTALCCVGLSQPLVRPWISGRIGLVIGCIELSTESGDRQPEASRLGHVLCGGVRVSVA